MDCDGMVSPLTRLPAKKAVGFLHWYAAVAALAALLGAPSGAGAQTVIGGTSPDVQVDLSVLDSLGPAPTLPDRLRRQLPAPRPSVAAPPLSHAAHSAKLHAPKAARK